MNYKYHLFFCCNMRDDGKAYCGRFGSEKMYRYTKDKCRDMGLLSNREIAVSQSRCLGQCELGPVMVIYPENTWYRWVDEEDINEIIESHLLNHCPVRRLQIQ